MDENNSLLEHQHDADSAENEPTPDITRRIVLHVYDDESKEFTSLTTYHGMIRIYSSATWPSRIFWSLVVVTCLTLFMIHSGLMLFFYNSHPTFIHSTDVKLTYADLPSITICRIQGSNDTVGNDRHVISYLNDDPLDIHTIIQLESNGSNILEQFLEQKTLCTDTISRVRVGGKVVLGFCSNSKQVLTDLGYCISFDHLPSPDPSLPIEIGVHRHLTDRVVFQVHSQFSPGPMKSRGLHLARGFKTIIPIQVRKQTLLKSNDWGTCEKGWNTSYSGNSSYSSHLCELNCIAKHYKTRCNCVPFFANNDGPDEVCSLSQMIEYKPTDGEPFCECPLECERSIYEHKTSTLARQRDSTGSTLQIVFPSKKMIIDTQLKRIKAVDLLSFVAGSMGLFLGMSCVTLLEVFIYLFKSIWGAFNDERHKFYMENLLGGISDPMMTTEPSYEQIVITTKVNGSERNSFSASQSEIIEEENYAITKNSFNRRTSIVPLGRRISKVPSLPRSRSNTANTAEAPSDLRVQLLRPNLSRRKSTYTAFGNF